MFSNDYYATNNWYEPESDDIYYMESTLRENAADLLELVLSQLYSQKELDLCKLENHLDELCYLVGMEPKHGDMTIRRI